MKIRKIALGLLFVLGVGVAAYSARTDIWTLQGSSGATRGKDLARVDSSGNFKLYNGSVYLGDVGTTPSTSSGGYYGLHVPFYNASGSTLTQGMVVIASATATSTGYASVAAVLATTTVLGVCDGSVTTGTVGTMTVAGYALVLTTGTVAIGDLLTSTNTVAGYAGTIAGSTSVQEGSTIGKAMSVGTTTGGLTLTKLN